MTAQRHRGFTIIEVMLFLAITGALAAGILVGSGAAINRQRYRDSVNSFKGVIQEQYSQVANVVNSEADNPQCSPTGESLNFDDSNLQTRGTSECLVIGRFILVEETTVTTANLIGEPAAGGVVASNDNDALRQYSMAIQTPSSYEIAWGARVVDPGSNTGTTTSVMVVRSPISGSILTYVRDGDRTGDILSMIGDSFMVEKNFCVDSDGALSALASRQAVRINARASNQSAVEVPLESENVCD